MIVRRYNTQDCSKIANLFYETVHAINVKDYTKEQLCVWATNSIDLSTWDRSFLTNYVLVAEENGTIVGFGDMSESGYLDRLYTHKNYQGKGVATAIVAGLEQQAILRDISLCTTHASITAKAFFEKRGYLVVCENRVVRGGVTLINFLMQKSVL